MRERQGSQAQYADVEAAWLALYGAGTSTVPTSTVASGSECLRWIPTDRVLFTV